MEAGQRAELEQMRNILASRIEHLDDEVAYGNISVEEKQRILSEEFGPDYRDSLVLLNTIIHHEPRSHDILAHVPLAVAILTVLGITAILTAFLYPAITGAVVGESGYLLGVEMEDGDSVPLPIADPMRIASIDATFAGSGEYTLIVHHAEGSMPLLAGDASGQRCPGCDRYIEPPFSLTLRSSAGTLQMGAIAYE